MTKVGHDMGFRLALMFVGLFGVAFAIAGLLVGLPRPAVGGTCGPGRSSESAIVAFFDPGSIGAGTEPATTSATDRADWMAFVGECQASADSRVLGTFAILIVSIGIATVGTALALGGSRRSIATPTRPGPSPERGGWAAGSEGPAGSAAPTGFPTPPTPQTAEPVGSSVLSQATAGPVRLE